MPVPFIPDGVFTACLAPYDGSLAMDFDAYRKHLVETIGVTGVRGIAQAGEFESCTPDELKQAISVLVSTAGRTHATLASVYQEMDEAAEYSKFAEAAGVSALMLYPSRNMYSGGAFSADVARRQILSVANASALPILLFQFPRGSGRDYPLQFLKEIVSEVPQIVGIKDWSIDPLVHDQNIRVFQGLERPVNVLTAHSSWLLGSLAMGSKGLCSSTGAIIPDEQARLFEAVASGAMKSAAKISARMQILSDLLYEEPVSELHSRTKVAAVALGRLPNANVRPPLAPLSEAAAHKITTAVDEYKRRRASDRL